LNLESVDLTTLLPLIGILIATSLVAGTLAGLLGVGGGIVIVPALEFLLRYAGVEPEARMHLAVATSLATIIPTSITSLRSHHRRGAVDWSLVRSWALPMLAASLAASILAARASSGVLTAIFGFVALLVSVKMFLPLDYWRIADQVPRGLGGGIVASGIGGVSAVMGIGGGTLGVPLLTLTGFPIHKAVGTAATFGLLISVPGTLGFLFVSPSEPVPVGTVGYVSLLGFLVIAPGAMLMAPVGARLAHALDKRTLSQAFGVFLFIVAARMLYRSFN
jgi:uncharacterized protein